MKIFLLIIIFASIPYFSEAQSSYQAGILPSININKKLPADYKLNFKVESRQELKSGFFDTPENFSYEYVLTDFSVLVAKKIAINKSLAVGYLARLQEGKLINRSIQQFILTKSYSGFKLAHRFSADQTFAEDDDSEFRLRYRISSQIPFSGQSVDPKEFYLKLSNEYLNSWQGGDYDFEIRVVPFVGYQFSDTKKLEWGIDYRIDSFLVDSSRNRFWVGINWYQSM